MDTHGLDPNDLAQWFDPGQQKTFFQRKHGCLRNTHDGPIRIYWLAWHAYQ